MAGLFSSATREQIRAASDIVDIIGSYLPLKRAGASFVALCPFHKEKSPSFNVNPHLQIFKCFGCQKGGDVFAFVKEYESIDFPEAVRRLAERARIPLDYEKDAGEQQSRHLKEKLLQIHEQLTQLWQSALALVEKAGLILRKEGSDSFYDRFRGRLIFPICDEQGRVVGFSGRVLSG